MPTEVVLACHVAMALGTMIGGWRCIVKTMGQVATIRLRPVDEFCTETAAVLTLAGTTSFGGIPVGTPPAHDYRGHRGRWLPATGSYGRALGRGWAGGLGLGLNDPGSSALSAALVGTLLRNL